MKRYLVHYGVPFNVKCRQFDTEVEARKFIQEHVFSDIRYCRLEKVEELIEDFAFVNHWDAKDVEVGRKLFETGIAKKEELECQN